MLRWRSLHSQLTILTFGVTLVGITLTNLENEDAVQLVLPLEARANATRSVLCRSNSSRRAWARASAGRGGGGVAARRLHVRPRGARVGASVGRTYSLGQ